MQCTLCGLLTCSGVLLLSCFFCEEAVAGEVFHYPSVADLKFEYEPQDDPNQIRVWLQQSVEAPQALAEHPARRLPAVADDTPCGPAQPRFSFWMAIPWETRVSIEEIHLATGPNRTAVFGRNPALAYEGVEQGAPVVVERPCDADEILGLVSSGPVAKIRLQGVLRSHQVALIDVLGGEYDEATHTYHPFGQVVLDLLVEPDERNPAAPRATFVNEDEHFLPLYESVIVNLDDAEAGGLSVSSTNNGGHSLPAPPEPMPPWGAQELEVRTDAAGLYILDWSSLLNAGVPVRTLDPDTFRLYRAGEELSLFVHGAEDGSFDSSDFIAFYAWGPQDDYEIEAVHYLTYGDDKGLRVDSRSVQPFEDLDPQPFYWRTTRLEDTWFFFPTPPDGAGGEMWYWEVFYAGDSYTFDLGLDHCEIVDEESAFLTVGLLGATDIQSLELDHHITLDIGEDRVSDLWWGGQEYLVAESEFSAATLCEGYHPNLLEIAEPGDTGDDLDLVYLDWIELTYPADFFAANGLLDAMVAVEDESIAIQVQDLYDEELLVLDIVDQVNPVLLEGWQNELAGGLSALAFQDEGGEHRYLVVNESAWLTPTYLAAPAGPPSCDPECGGDLIIVSHPDFLDALAPLVDVLEGDGTRVELISTEEAYYAFSNGVPTPEAIRDLVSWAYTEWEEPAPYALMLVGDATIDFNGLIDDLPDNVNYLPTFHIEDEHNGYLATDNPFVTVAGDDDLPDLYVGRVPADSPEEVEAYVANALSYLQEGSSGAWARRALLVADSGFGEATTLLIENLPDFIHAEQLDLDECTEGGWSVDDVTESIIDTVDAGVALLTFYGHGGHANWTSGGILRYEDLDSFANGPAFPVVAALTCLNGYFDNAWSDEVLAEGFTVGGPDRGAIGVMATTRDVGGSDILDLGERLVRELYVEDNTQLGAAVTAARLGFIAENAWSTNAFLMTSLFGSPVLDARVPAASDVDGSGRIDGLDLIQVSRQLGREQADDCMASLCVDIDGDEWIDMNDVEILVESFGELRY